MYAPTSARLLAVCFTALMLTPAHARAAWQDVPQREPDERDAIVAKLAAMTPAVVSDRGGRYLIGDRVELVLLYWELGRKNILAGAVLRVTGSLQYEYQQGKLSPEAVREIEVSVARATQIIDGLKPFGATR